MLRLVFAIFLILQVWVVTGFQGFPKAPSFKNFRSILQSSLGHTDSDGVTSQQQLKESVIGVAGVSTQAAIGAISAALVGAIANPLAANAKDSKKIWEQVDIPTKDTIFDITFDSEKPDHGWLVGTKSLFLETFDAGKTWTTRTFQSLDEDEDINYRFEVASLYNDEGWIIGKPAIMLHTKDGGKQFERIPVSPKLPGEPVSIKATGPGQAEMITSQGAVYVTTNGGLNWKAQVKETIDATLNRVSSSGTSGASYFTGKLANEIRDVAGNYLAIGSRGNLFLTWRNGQDYWIPHNRGSSRRIQNMGFVQNDATKGMWMTLNGGAVLLTPPNPNLDQIDLETVFETSKINSGGYGIIDMAWRSDQEVWAVGGSGIIFESKDGGKSFKFNGDAKDIPGNLYRVKFFDQNRGFAIGSNGVLLQFNA